MNFLTPKQVEECFEYKEDGHLYWKIHIHSTVVPGDKAGYFSKSNKVWRINFGSRCYYEKHLIWLLFKGELPKRRLKFLNGDKLDTRIENLY